MKPIYLLLASLLLVAAGVIWLGLTPQPEYVAGMAHTDIAGMRVGGDVASIFSVTYLPSMMIQTGTLAAMCSLMFLAFSRQQKTWGLAAFFVSGFVFSFVTWNMINSFYIKQLEGDGLQYFLGFPMASSIAVYGVWTAGLLFSAYYVFGFKKWVFSDEDQQKFDELVAKYRPETEGWGQS